MIRNDIPIATLREKFSYDPDSGIISWRIARPGRYAGARAGTVMTNGYIYIKIDQVYYLAHRIAWALVQGQWPTSKLDHRDGCPTNNKLSNLRLASDTQNGCNKRVQRNNRTGVKGVFTHGKRYTSRVGYRGKSYYVGYFDTVEEAKAAREIVARRLHGEFARS